jgi:protein-S-isoprenylcysteine O-methyltransferase Ste14
MFYNVKSVASAARGRHDVVDTGPMRSCAIRSTGAIAATLATAAAEATLPALIGFTLITLGLWLKARIEERFLREELGPQAYDAYRRRVPMLLPFGPRAA